MGLFDKVKGFLNVDGLKVAITRLEDPFPVKDSVHKGRFVLTAGSDVEVLSTNVKLVARWQTYLDGKSDQEKVAVIAEDNSLKVRNMDLSYPFKMSKGEEKELGFIIININIMAQLEKWGIKDRWEKLQSTRDLRFNIEMEADAKGTPFDPTALLQFNVVPGGGSEDW